MTINIKDLPNSELLKLKRKLEKQLEKVSVKSAPYINSRDDEITKMAVGIKSLAKSKRVPPEAVVDAICRRFRLKLVETNIQE